MQWNSKPDRDWLLVRKTVLHMGWFTAHRKQGIGDIMALAGTGKALGDKIAALIIAPNADPGVKADIMALWENIGDVIVDHVIANAQVPPGISVSTTGGPAAQTGSTTSAGQIT
jgi:hypothetical protein